MVECEADGGVVDEEHYGTDEVDEIEEERLSNSGSVNGSPQFPQGLEQEDGRTVVDFVFAREEVLRRERKRSQTILLCYSVLTLGTVLFIVGYLTYAYRNMPMEDDD
jgi:hypothetical protein